ncbi:MAG: uracil-DNA glycosylase [Proteobacteria bacterium]|nr:uracil-DNA glycosylase [Pseudomonadota bacterium]
MEASLNPAQLLQWYIEVGADEAIGIEPIDRIGIVEKQAAPTAAVLPIASTPSPSHAPAIGAIEFLNTAKTLASAAQTLEELKTALESFQGISLKRTATQMVFADGIQTAKVMLVGEAPDADEDRIGRPFVGVRGQLLDNMLASIGLSREQNVYITNVVNWYPPGNRALSDTEVTLSLPFIQRHIELVRPTVLIYVGGVAAKALLQTRQSITALHGKWKEYSSEGLPSAIPSMALFHPDYLLASPAQKALAWADLLALRKKLKMLGLT